MTKKILYITCLIFTISVINTAAQEKIPTDSVKLIAAEGLQQQLQLMKADDIKHYGFNSYSDLEKITLGGPIRVCGFKKAFYTDSILNTAGYIINYNIFYVPLIVDDTIRSFIKVARMKNKWKVVGAGANILAANISGCIQSNNLKRGKMHLLSEHSTNTDFLFTADSALTENTAVFPVQMQAGGFNRNLPGKSYLKRDLFPLLKGQYLKNKINEQ